MADEVTELQAALANHYRFERELGRGGMALRRGRRKAAEGGEGSPCLGYLELSSTTHHPPHTAQ